MRFLHVSRLNPKGGSRDVAVACLKRIFSKTPPINVPYEFFLVSGAKMSSSKGIGTSARMMADFLPADVLRFLMIRTPARRTVNFSTDFKYVIKLYNDYDKFIGELKSGDDSARRLSEMVRVNDSKPLQVDNIKIFNFQLIVSLLQLPHIDVKKELIKRAENNVSQYEEMLLDERIASAKYWLDNFGTEHEKFEVKENLPQAYKDLTHSQREFLQNLSLNISRNQNLTDDYYQQLIFDTARLNNLPSAKAFHAIYKVLLDRDRGPKAGALLAYLSPDFLIERFTDLEFSQYESLNESCLTDEELYQWIKKSESPILNCIITGLFVYKLPQGSQSPKGCISYGKGVGKISILFEDKRTYGLNVTLLEVEGVDLDPDNEALYLKEEVIRLSNHLSSMDIEVINDGAIDITKETVSDVSESGDQKASGDLSDIIGDSMEVMIDDKIFDKFPDFSLGFFVVDNLEKVTENIVNGEEPIESAKKKLEELGIQPKNASKNQLVGAWRPAFSKCGVKPSKYMSSVEQLVRRVSKGDDISSPVPVVNAYCGVSAEYLTPMGGYDIDRLPEKDIRIRYASPDKDTFTPLGGRASSMQLTEDVVVYGSGDEVICWCFNHRDSINTCLKEGTNKAIFFSEGVIKEHSDAIHHGLTALGAYFSKNGGSVSDIYYLDKSNTKYSLGIEE